MSRIGRQPIRIPDGVRVEIEGNRVAVKGPKGELSRDVHPDMRLRLEDGQLRVERPSDEKQHRALHGLTRNLLANMVEGVTQGFTKRLEIRGVGYRAQKQGQKLVLNIGFSHPVEISPPAGIEVEVPAPTRIEVRGIDKEAVGQVAANIRHLRRADPYLGKGILYAGEQLRRKAGKAGKVAK